MRVAIGLAVAVAVAALFLGARDTSFFEAIEGQSLDWYFKIRGPRAPGTDIVILAIDDRTLQAIGPWPLPRNQLAEILLAVGRDSARVVAIDLLFGEATRAGTPNEDTARLVEALSILGKAAVAFAFTAHDAEATPGEAPAALAASAYRVKREIGDAAPSPLLRPTGVLAPANDILSAVPAGHVNVVLDADGQLRHALPAWPTAVSITRRWRSPLRGCGITSALARPW